MRDRLTTNKTKIFARESPTLMSITKSDLRDLYNEVFDRLQEYEVAEEQGQIIVPPCKVGEVVYFHGGINRKLIKSAVVDEIIINDCGISDLLVTTENGVAFENSIDIFYLTKEEAEAALRKEDEGK